MTHSEGLQIFVGELRAPGKVELLDISIFGNICDGHLRDARAVFEEQ